MHQFVLTGCDVTIWIKKYFTRLCKCFIHNLHEMLTKSGSPLIQQLQIPPQQPRQLWVISPICVFPDSDVGPSFIIWQLNNLQMTDQCMIQWKPINITTAWPWKSGHHYWVVGLKGNDWTFNLVQVLKSGCINKVDLAIFVGWLYGRILLYFVTVSFQAIIWSENYM